MKKKRIAYAFSRQRFNERIDTNFPGGVIPGDYAVVSISYYKDKNHRLCDAHNVLNMDFDDIDAETAIMPTDLERSWESFAQWLVTHYRTGVKSWAGDDIFCMGTDWKIFDWMDALRLADFIYTNKDCNFLIHCEAGMSRSQAVVKLLNDLLGDRYDYEKNPDNNNCFPNMWVVNATKRVIRLMIDIGIWKEF